MLALADAVASTPSWLPQLIGSALGAVIIGLLWKYVEAKDKAADERHKELVKQFDEHKAQDLKLHESLEGRLRHLEIVPTSSGR